jgi:hypothetical protein
VKSQWRLSAAPPYTAALDTFSFHPFLPAFGSQSQLSAVTAHNPPEGTQDQSAYATTYQAFHLPKTFL